MAQWVSTPPVWTARSADEWLGDGSATVAQPIAAGYAVLDHFASILTIVDVEHFLLSCHSHPATVAVSGEIIAEVLRESFVLQEPLLTINTRVHPVCQEVGFYLLSAYGTEMTMARQDILLHVQTTPKNPIVMSDVTMDATALSVALSVPVPIYGGVYEQVDAGVLDVGIYAWASSPEVITTIHAPVMGDLAVTMAAGPTVGVDSVAHQDMAVPARLQLQAITPVVSVGAYPDAVCMTYLVLQETIVAVGFAMQDDIHLSIDMGNTEIWHDNEINCGLAGMAISPRQSQVRSSSVVAASELGLSLACVEPEYAGAHFYEWAILESSITTQIILECPANIREYVYA